MIPDHYATLGVDPDASAAEIRAAYLKLMRRFHPDRNASPRAAAQSYAITAAYAVLGARDQRAQYDQDRRSSGAPPRSVQPTRPASLRGAPWMAVGVGIALVLLLVPLISPPPGVPARGDQLASVGGVQKAPPQEQNRAESGVDPHVLCTLPVVSDIIKNALFNRAAQLRRGNSAADFGSLATLSVLRFDLSALSAKVEDGVVNCDAVVALDLPARLKVEGRGFEGVSGRIGYSLKPACSGAGGMIRLTAMDSIVPVLATAAPAAERLVRAAPSISAPDPSSAPDPDLTNEPPTIASAVPPTAQPAPRRESSPLQQPSFSCRAAQTLAARLVCNSPRLAQVDRELASLYGRAASDASKVPLLVPADARFLAIRDACSSEQCVLSAYLGAINEIQQIQAGQQRPR